MFDPNSQITPPRKLEARSSKLEVLPCADCDTVPSFPERGNLFRSISQENLGTGCVANTDGISTRRGGTGGPALHPW